jgi:hypothetical protein
VATVRSVTTNGSAIWRLVSPRASRIATCRSRGLRTASGRSVPLDDRVDPAVAIADEAGAPSSCGTIANDPAAVRKLMTRLGGPEIELRVAYEAGPTGCALHRQLAGLSIACLVVAPSLVPKRPGDKVKTDRRDALKLARPLRSGDLTPIWVPDEAHHAPLPPMDKPKSALS